MEHLPIFIFEIVLIVFIAFVALAGILLEQNIKQRKKMNELYEQIKLRDMQLQELEKFVHSNTEMVSAIANLEPMYYEKDPIKYIDSLCEHIKMKKKIDVKLINTTKDIDSFLDEIGDVDQFQKEREERLKGMVSDFEVYLLNEAIRLKSKVLFIVNFTKYEDLKNRIRSETIFKSFVDKDAAYEFLSQAKKEDFYASVCDYNFDKLLKMSDDEFEGLPDLGDKDLARKYREVMCVDIEQNDNNA